MSSTRSTNPLRREPHDVDGRQRRRRTGDVGRWSRLERARSAAPQSHRSAVHQGHVLGRRATISRLPVLRVRQRRYSVRPRAH